MEQHSILLLGLGFWGSNWMRTLRRRDNCPLAGIAGSKEDIDRLSKEYDLSNTKAFPDFHQAIESTDADIIIIAIPTKFHAEAAKLALAKGMNVISEKPLAMNLAEAKDVITFKKNYPQLKYMVDQNYRWRPHNQTVQKAIQSGMIGRLGAIHFEFRQPEDLLGYREFLDMPLLQDVSIHHFDLLRFWTQKNCKQVFATSFRPAWSKFQGNPAVEAILRMENNVIVNYSGTWAARGKETSWDGNVTFTGDKGCLTLDAQNSVHFFKVGESKPVKLENVAMNFTELDYALDTFIGCIERHDTPETDPDDNIHSFAIVQAAEESARTQSVAKLRVWSQKSAEV